MNRAWLDDVWFTLARNTALRIHVGDFCLEEVVVAGDKGWLLGLQVLERRMLGVIRRAHHIHLIMNVQGYSIMKSAKQLAAVLSQIQEIAGWENKAITVDIGPYSKALYRSAGRYSTLVSAAVEKLLAECELGRIVPQPANEKEGAAHWRTVWRTYRSRFQAKIEGPGC